MLLYLEALASHLPSVTSMLPVFSCAQVRYGNAKADPDGGSARCLYVCHDTCSATLLALIIEFVVHKRYSIGLVRLQIG